MGSLCCVVLLATAFYLIHPITAHGQGQANQPGSRTLFEATVPDHFDPDYGLDQAASKARLQRFETAMDSLSKSEAPSIGDSSVEAEVVRIAKYRAAHPEVFNEIIEIYLRHWNTSSRAPAMPRPRQPHLNEKYRL